MPTGMQFLSLIYPQAPSVSIILGRVLSVSSNWEVTSLRSVVVLEFLIAWTFSKSTCGLQKRFLQTLQSLWPHQQLLL